MVVKRLMGVVSFFVRPQSPFLRPGPLCSDADARSGVKAGRRSELAKYTDIARLYCTTVVRQAAASFISCGLIHGRLLVGPDLSRRPVAMAGNQPVGIVPGGEIQQRQA